MPDELYTEYILDEAESPYHFGHLENPSIAHDEKSPVCGDEIHLELLVDSDARVKEAWFDGKGCAISRAAASFLMREIEGKSVEELKSLQARQALDLLKSQVTARRQKCG